MATLVQIKRSTANASPTTLNEGELAYSYLSNVIFVGDTAGGVMNIGGQYYTDLIDNASAANGASTIVRRYANGSAQFDQLDIITSPTANAHAATKEYVDLALTSNVSLNVLTNVIVVGDAAAQNNRILVGHANGTYITTDVSGNVSITNTGIITIGTEQVVGSMLANTLVGSKTFANNITVGEDLTVTGNLYVLGNTTTVDTETLVVEDSLIKLANNNSTDTVDIGFYGVYDSNTYAGLFRDATDGIFKLFTDYAGGDPTANTIGAVARATLQANIDAELINTVALGVQSLTATAHSVLTSANLSATLNVASDTYIGGDLTVDGGDIVSTATANLLNVTSTTINFGGDATAISIGSATGNTVINHNLDVANNLVVTGQISANVLTLSNPLGTSSGGTGLSSFTANGVWYADTTSTIAFATGAEGQVLQIASGVPAFAMLDGGSF